jgi:hypothetical protein
MEKDDSYFYIYEGAHKSAIYTDEIYCDYPANLILHTPLPLDRIDEVLYGRS